MGAPYDGKTHWVEDLFRPHFSRQEVVRSLTALQPAGLDPSRAERRRRMYEDLLAQPSSPAGEDEQSSTIWTRAEVAALIGALRRMELDRWTEQMQRRRMQDTLDERDQQLLLSRQEAEALRARVQALGIEMQKKVEETARYREELQEKVEETARYREELQEKVEETARYREELQEKVEETARYREELQETRTECRRLSREMARLSQQQKAEDQTCAEVAGTEQDELLCRLQQEVEDVRAELEAERRCHRRSQTALEVLRRHFTGGLVSEWD
uniref:Uncharacterized protein n=1 Tax=Denticeps clupeoides TaxID=299321 RepID=A0AAY4D6I0_9TELE